MRESEQRKKLMDYIQRNLKKSYTLEALKWALIKQGYSRVLVEKAIEDTHQEMAKKAPILRDKPQINYSIVDENDKPVNFKKSWWKKLFGL